MSRTEGNSAKVSQIMREHHWLTVRSIAEQANFNIETVRKILTEYLDMRKGCAKKNGHKGPTHTALSVREFLARKK
jgi:hypothetical protein